MFVHKENLQHCIITIFDYIYPFKDEAQAALFKDPVRTAL
jgi:hypothetical protein